MTTRKDPLRGRLAGVCFAAIASVTAGCASPERLAYEALQQRECVTSAGVACPAQSGGYDQYRAQRTEALGKTAAGG